MQKLSSILLISLFFLFSCQIISFEELESRISITEKEMFYEKEFVEINFSLNMNQKSVENLLILKKNDYSIDCDFFWNGKCLKIKPEESFHKGNFYTISLSGSVESNDGKIHSINIQRIFIFGNEKELLYLSSFTVPEKEKSDFLELTFNKPLDISSFELNFQISPNLSAKKEYSNDLKKVKIVPDENWKTNTFYVWSVEGIKSQDGYAISGKTSDNFLYSSDSESLYVKEICPVTFTGEKNFFTNGLFCNESGLEKIFITDSIGIVFSKPVSVTEVTDNFSMTPSVNGFFLSSKDSKSFIFVPYDDFSIKEKYEVLISKDIDSENGISMKENFRRVFVPQNDFLEIEKITMNENLILEKEPEINEMILPDSGICFTTIDFSTSIPDSQKQNVMDSISFASIFPSYIESPNLLSAYWSSSGIRLTLQWNNFKSSDDEKDVYYKIRISGGNNSFTNQRKEYLKEDLCFTIRSE